MTNGLNETIYINDKKIKTVNYSFQKNLPQLYSNNQ